MFREAMKEQTHDRGNQYTGGKRSNATPAKADRGKAYTLTRLQKDNPEEEAKKASRSARAAEMVKAGTHTQAEAARELGVSKQAVNKAISQPNAIKPPKVDRIKTPVIGLSADPHRTAANIHAASSTSAGRSRSVLLMGIRIGKVKVIKVITLKPNKKPMRLSPKKLAYRPQQSCAMPPMPRPEEVGRRAYRQSTYGFGMSPKWRHSK